MYGVNEGKFFFISDEAVYSQWRRRGNLYRNEEGKKDKIIIFFKYVGCKKNLLGVGRIPLGQVYGLKYISEKIIQEIEVYFVDRGLY